MGNVTRSAPPRPPAAHTTRVGSLIVGDHVGQPAATAAQAVRRAGLRPGLDRSFGHPREDPGRVVAQEPPAGSEVTRNAMVTLYVAAPGAESTPAAEEPAVANRSPQPSVTDSSWEPSPPPNQDRPAVMEHDEQQSEESARHGWFEQQPAAATAGYESPGLPTGRAPDGEPAGDWSHEPAEPFDRPVEDPFRAPSGAGRAPRRTYPRTPPRLRITRLARRLRAHRKAAILGGLLLIVLVAHGFAGEVRRDPASTVARGSTAAPSLAAQRQAPEVRAKPATARAKAVPVARRRRHRHTVAHVAHVRTRAPTATPVNATTPMPAPSAPPTGGGPFSP